MERLFKFFIDRSFLVNLITGFVCVVGLLVTFNMKRDLVPPFEFQSIKVTAAVPGAAPHEIEEFVAYPLEDALKGLPGMEKMVSTSKNGSLSMTLFFKASFDRMTETVEQVKSITLSVRPRLPKSVEYIDVVRARQDRVFLFWMAMKNFDEENVEHRQWIKKFEQTVSKIEGVVQVAPEIRPRDLYVEFDARKLEAYELSVSDIRASIAQAVSMMPLGQLAENEETWSFELQRTIKHPDELGELPVAGNRRGDVVRLKDVATIGYKLTAQAEIYRMDGQPALGLVIRKDTNSDSIDLKKVVDKKIAEFNAALPAPLKIEPVVDGPRFIVQQLNVLYNNGLFGIVFVFLLLVLFLNWRTSLMVIWGLPISYLGTMIILHQMGIAIDLISIIGLILVVGILVDDAIIVSERYVENLSDGMPPKKAALEAVKDLIVPVTGTVLTTIVAFSPILLVKSEMSIILAAVPIVIIASLSLSWLESFFILPNHLAHFVPRQDKSSRRERVFESVKKVYKRMLQATVRFRYLALAGLVGLSAATVVVAQKLKQDFDLNVNSEKVAIYPTLKKSDSLEETYAKIKAIEEFALKLPKEKVASVTTWVGGVWRDGRNQPGYRFSEISLYLHADESYPTKVKEEVKAAVQEALKTVKTDEFESIDVDEREYGDDEKKENIVSVRIKGGNDVEFKEIEDAIIAQSLKAEGVLEHVPEADRYQTAWRFVPDAQRLVRYGFAGEDFALQIKNLFIRDELIETRAGGQKFFIYTKMLPQQPLEFEKLQAFEVVSSNGRRVPLSRLGEWKNVKSLARISHHNGDRSLVVDFKFDDKKTNATKVKTDVSAALAGVSPLFPTYNIEVIDANEEETKSRAWAIRVALICLISVFMVLAVILGSLTQPFLVALPIPFGVLGIIWALYLHDLPMGLMALIGLVGTIGVSVNDSLIMVDQVNKLSARFGGLSKYTIIEGAVSRLRAIILTTVTTVGGVFPMAYSVGGESGFTQPLAFSIGWGLTFSTVLTLFILPAILAVYLDFTKIWMRVVLRFRKDRSAAAEPAIGAPADPARSREPELTH